MKIQDMGLRILASMQKCNSFKIMGIVLRVLAGILMVAFLVAGVLLGKLVTWFSASALTDLSKIFSLAMNPYAAIAVWLLGLCLALITYGQGMVLSKLAELDGPSSGKPRARK